MALNEKVYPKLSVEFAFGSRRTLSKRYVRRITMIAFTI